MLASIARTLAALFSGIRSGARTAMGGERLTSGEWIATLGQLVSVSPGDCTMTVDTILATVAKFTGSLGLASRTVLTGSSLSALLLDACAKLTTAGETGFTKLQALTDDLAAMVNKGEALGKAEFETLMRHVESALGPESPATTTVVPVTGAVPPTSAPTPTVPPAAPPATAPAAPPATAPAA